MLCSPCWQREAGPRDHYVQHVRLGSPSVLGAKRIYQNKVVNTPEQHLENSEHFVSYAACPRWWSICTGIVGALLYIETASEKVQILDPYMAWGSPPHRVAEADSL